MAEIQGKYLLRMEIPETYTLTGNDRNALITVNDDTILDVIDVVKKINPLQGDCFKFENMINIKRARIYAAGGAGIQPAADGTPAAFLRMNIKQLYDGSGRKLSRFFITIPKWEEWIDINIEVEPYCSTPDPWTGSQADKHPCRLIIENSTKFSIDDYNIQADFVGQDIKPILELEIYTAGIIDMQGGRIY